MCLVRISGNISDSDRRDQLRNFLNNEEVGVDTLESGQFRDDVRRLFEICKVVDIKDCVIGILKDHITHSDSHVGKSFEDCAKCMKVREDATKIS